MHVINITNKLNNKKRVRLEALSHYGGKCNCCGESREILLSLDHINGDGHNWKITTRKDLPRYLRTLGWPTDIQVLCYNCNFSKRKLAMCPCKVDTQTVAEKLDSLPREHDGTTGSKHHMAVLDEAKAHEIKASFLAGETIVKLALKYNVNYQTIWNIVTGRTWKQVV